MLENEIEREDKWLKYKIDLYLRISDFDDDASLFGIDLIIELTFDFDEQGYFDKKKNFWIQFQIELMTFWLKCLTFDLW